jgi:hypothetical protein
VGDGKIDTVLVASKKLVDTAPYAGSARKLTLGAVSLVGYDTSGDGRIDAFDTTGGDGVEQCACSVDAVCT